MDPGAHEIIRPLYEHAGPWATVYLDTAGNGDWPVAREQLERAGADEATLGALEGAAHGEAGGGGLALFAADGELVLAQALTPGSARLAQASWAALPRVAPLLAATAATGPAPSTGGGGGIVRGVAEVVAAAQAGRVGTLLLVAGAALPSLWIDPEEPLRVALDPADLAAMGVAEPVRARADDALIAAAVAAGADVFVVEPPLAGDVGALLRPPPG